MVYTVITGASSGIGKALANKFAAKGHNLIITARREAELQANKEDIEQRFQVDVIVYPCDLAEKGKPGELYESDKVVGMVNAENTLDLLDPVFPLFG